MGSIMREELSKFAVNDKKDDSKKPIPVKVKFVNYVDKVFYQNKSTKFYDEKGAETDNQSLALAGHVGENYFIRRNAMGMYRGTLVDPVLAPKDCNYEAKVDTGSEAAFPFHRVTPETFEHYIKYLSSRLIKYYNNAELLSKGGI